MSSIGTEGREKLHMSCSPEYSGGNLGGTVQNNSNYRTPRKFNLFYGSFLFFMNNTLILILVMFLNLSFSTLMDFFAKQWSITNDMKYFYISV